MKTSKPFFSDAVAGGKPGRVMLWVILAAGIAARIFICFFTGLPHMHRDSIDYFQQADALLAGSYINYFPNGFPFIIAAAKGIFGSQAIYALLVLNLLFAAFTMLFVYGIARKVFNSSAIGLLAMLILAVFPTQINYTRWLTSEVPGTFFLAGGYYYYLCRKNIVSGIFFGLLFITRTEMIPVLILLGGWELIRLRRLNWKLGAAAALPVLATAFYCYSKTGNFSIAGHGRVNIMYSTTARGSEVDWYFVDKHPEINTTGKALKLYFEHIRTNPKQYLKNRLLNIWNLWGFYPDSSDGNRGTAARLVIGLGNLFMMLFGFYSLWQNRKNFNAVILIFPFLVITAVHLFFLALPRYTYPAEPFLIVLSAWSLYCLLRGSSGRSAAHE